MKLLIVILCGCFLSHHSYALSEDSKSGTNAIACFTTVYSEKSVNFNREESIQLCSGGGLGSAAIACFTTVYGDKSVNFNREESILLCRGAHN